MYLRTFPSLLVTIFPSIACFYDLIQHLFSSPTNVYIFEWGGDSRPLPMWIARHKYCTLVQQKGGIYREVKSTYNPITRVGP